MYVVDHISFIDALRLAVMYMYYGNHSVITGFYMAFRMRKMINCLYNAGGTLEDIKRLLLEQ